ncbi:MAG: (2Fe-2S)-binding protein, partial [Thermoleophilia bacterium]|nr:(2Fe-2S)-binding protein [Thermoleophilia bacterium]
MPTLTVDDVEVEVPAGASVLEACRRAGASVPSLCYLEGREAIGACRLCMVEVEGAKTLVASCAQLASEGMVVLTSTPRVRRARRAVLELLLSEHNGDCYTCVRSGDCELRRLSYALGIDRISYQGERARKYIDASTPALVRDTGKCVSCRRCVVACNEIQGVGALFPQGRSFSSEIGPATGRDLSGVVCVQCGQCAAVCPVGAIVEKSAIDGVWAALDDPAKHVIVQTAPAVRAALGEEFGYEPGTRVTGKMVAALRRLGFDGVFDTNFAADLTIMEEGTELLGRLKKALVDKEPAALPMFTSCSPGWINYMEHFNPHMTGNLSTCKSPQQMFGAVAKTYYA